MGAGRRDRHSPAALTLDGDPLSQHFKHLRAAAFHRGITSGRSELSVETDEGLWQIPLPSPHGIGGATYPLLGVPAGAALMSGDVHACAFHGTSLWCWGRNVAENLGYPIEELPSSEQPVRVNIEATSAVAGGSSTCVTTNGEVLCLDTLLDPQPLQGAVQLSVNGGEGFSEACARLENGELSCTHVTVGDGTFIDVANTATSACGLRADGDAVCWGEEFDWSTQTYVDPSPAEGERFQNLTATPHRYCGTTSNNDLACWGDVGGEWISTPIVIVPGSSE